jgi:hypothetical protein
MARRNISRMRFLIDVSEAGTSYHTIDLWQSLSLQERKLFRQMQTCHVVGGLVHDSNQNAFVRFATAPDTWMTRASIRRAFKLWKKQRSMALSEAQAGITAGKYSDFKVYLNNAHGVGTIKPYDSQGNQLPAGEWDYTTLVSEDKDWSDPAVLANSNMASDKFELQIVGDSHIPGTGANQDTWSRVSLIKSWIDSRAEPTIDDPVVPATLATDPLANLFDEVDANDDILVEINNEGDAPPYDEDSFFGMREPQGSSNNLQRMALAHTSASNPTVRFAGFSAICGLVQVKLTASAAGTVEILMDVLHDGDKI